MREKVVLVACGTAIATSTVVANAIEEAARAAGIAVRTIQCKAAEVPLYAADADLIVTTTPVSQSHGKPVVQGLPFLTGTGKEATIDQILTILRS